MITDKTIKERWVAELRSGKHQQTFGTLGTVNPRTNKLMPDGPVCAMGALYRALDYNLSSDFLRIVPGLTLDDCRTIVCMNDDQKKPFSYIADHIEQNL